MPTRGVLRPRLSLIDVGVLVAVLVLLYVVLRVGSGATASFSPARLRARQHRPREPPLRRGAQPAADVHRAVLLDRVHARLRLRGGAQPPRREGARADPRHPPVGPGARLPDDHRDRSSSALFPGSELGLECASIFAIFTAQAWNMTFSFYASLKSLPRELDELSRSLRLTRWQRFWKIEVPSGAIGLVWNGMMSFGGSWFFLVASRGDHGARATTTRCPGSARSSAPRSTSGDLGAVGLAIATMIVMVVAVNVLFWRPLVAWCGALPLRDDRGQRGAALARARAARALVVAAACSAALRARARRAARPRDARSSAATTRRRRSSAAPPARRRHRSSRCVVGGARRLRRATRSCTTSPPPAASGSARSRTASLLGAATFGARRRAARVRDARLGADRRLDRHEPARRAARPADRAGPRELPGQLPLPVRDARVHHARHQRSTSAASC